MNKKGALAAALLAVLALLAGCYEDPNATLHEPGQYKGKLDPLLKQQTAARDQLLQKRFRLVQTDR